MGRIPITVNGNTAKITNDPHVHGEPAANRPRISPAAVATRASAA